MKKFLTLTILCLALALSGPAHAANYYFDLASGNDTTGDGTAGNPWKTIDKCTTGRSAGDECRGALTAITTLDGTLTFTDGSVTVSTSTDQSAVVAANDVISKQGNGEAWWKVASVASGAITLSVAYYGNGTGSGDAVTGYKITPTTSTDGDIQSAGSAGSYIKISGGWNLGTETQTGVTAFLSSEGSPLDWNARAYIWLDNFIILPGSNNCIDAIDGVFAKLTNIYCAGSTTYPSSQHINLSSNNAYLDTIAMTGGAGYGLVVDNLAFIENLYGYSVGTGVGDYGFYLNEDHAVIAKTIRFAGSPRQVLAIFSSSMIFIESFYFQNSGAYPTALINDSNNVRFSNGIFTGGAASFDAIGENIVFVNMPFDITTSFVGTASSIYPSISVCVTGSDCYLIDTFGKITHDSTAAARSGKALKFTPTTAKSGIAYRVGTVKISSVATDITLNAYLKDDADFNGEVIWWVSRNGTFVSKTDKTPTTSYVKESIVVAAADLVADEYLDLFVQAHGTTGNVWIDDFSAEQ